MNEAGRSAGPARGSYKLELDRVLVAARRDRPAVRRDPLRLGGGLAGHNGLKSLKRELGVAGLPPRADRRRAAGLDRPGDRRRLRARQLAPAATPRSPTSIVRAADEAERLVPRLGRSQLVAVAGRLSPSRWTNAPTTSCSRPRARARGVRGLLPPPRRRRCSAYFARRTRDAELAADLTAETFAAALDGAHRHRPDKGPAVAWLYGIARRKLAHAARKGAVEDRARRRLGHGAARRSRRGARARRGARHRRRRPPAPPRARRRCRPTSARRCSPACSTSRSTRRSRAAPARRSPSIRKRVSRGLAGLRSRLEGP